MCDLEKVDKCRRQISKSLEVFSAQALTVSEILTLQMCDLQRAGQGRREQTYRCYH